MELMVSLKTVELNQGYEWELIIIFCHPSQVDFRPSFACMPLSYPDSYYSELVAVYGPQALIHHPQMMGMVPARVPLPLDLPKDEPIYVNVKQYHAILRRRQYRAKLEAQNKVSKVRKPYLHESRHVHALKRARGSGGRFLNTKKLQGSKPAVTTNVQGASDSVQLHLSTKMSKSEVHLPPNYKEGTSTTSCSDITSASNSDHISLQQELRFSVYPSHIGGATQGGGGVMSGANRTALSESSSGR